MHEGTCHVCSSPFMARTVVQRRCGDRACDVTAEKERRAANPDRQREIDRATRERNRETIRVSGAAWRQRNRATQLRYEREWAEKNPDRARARCLKNQSRKRAERHGVEHVPYTIDELLALLPAGCALCHEDTGETVGWDHAIPMSKGGPDRIENIQPAHALCNRRKAATLLEASHG